MKRVRKKESSVILASQNLEDFAMPGIAELTKPLFSIPTHAFLFNAGNIDKKFYMDTLQLEESEYNLIRFPQRGVCLYKCGNERYNLVVHVTEDGRSRYFSIDDGLELLDAAKKVRSYLTAESAARPSGFEKMFLHPAEISAERFDELAGIRMRPTQRGIPFVTRRRCCFASRMRATPTQLTLLANCSFKVVSCRRMCRRRFTISQKLPTAGTPAPCKKK